MSELTALPDSKARKAGKPTVSKAFRGTTLRGKAFRASGIVSSACCPRVSMARAISCLPAA